MANGLGKLSAIAVTKTKKPGRYCDGGGLYLQVGPTGTKSWLFRFKLAGKSREMGLGPLATVSLAEARKAAEDARKLVHSGKDPIEHRKEEEAAAQAAKAGTLNFRQCAEAYIAAHEASWRNPKHRQQWRNTLATYAYPVFGEVPVGDVDLGMVTRVLEPIWPTKTETASRLRGRIEAILDWATVRGYRQGENPARWRGYLDKLMPKRSRLQRVQHHPALPYPELPAFMAALRAREGVSARALEFAILTATRTSETLNARWTEFDLEAAVWTIPGERMKGGKEHRVPLAPRCLAILEAMREIRQHEYVFPGAKKDLPPSNMVFLQLLKRMNRPDLTAHGFRSSFRDWAAERTSFPNIVAEAALAHIVADKTEAAYRRGDLFDKRRKLMEAWAAYCASPVTEGRVVPLRQKA